MLRLHHITLSDMHSHSHTLTQAHTHTHIQTHMQAVGLLWTSDQPEAETSTCETHTTYTRQTFTPPAGFEPAIPASEGRRRTL